MSFVPGSSRQPGPRQLQGSRPGLLDPTQPSRVLRYPNSTLSFAAFDPLAASGNAQPRKYAPDADPARPKRIVIETTPGNRVPSKWRFVPRARRAPGMPGLGDEGVWPRLVMINGYVLFRNSEPCAYSQCEVRGAGVEPVQSGSMADGC